MGTNTNSPAAERSPRRRSLWTRLGFAGFLFFLIKGLLWLIVPAAVWVSL